MPRIVPVLAIIASIVLLTQQTGVVWLGAAAHVVVGSILEVAQRLEAPRCGRAADDGLTHEARMICAVR